MTNHSGVIRCLGVGTAYSICSLGEIQIMDTPIAARLHAQSSRSELCLAAVAALALAGCTHLPSEIASEHYSTFEVPAPKGAIMHVRSAYGCRTQTKVKFSGGQLDEIRDVMKKTAKDDTPAEERRAVAYLFGDRIALANMAIVPFESRDTGPVALI